MRANDKKAAIAAYKERKITAGIYLVRCTASGETWVGACPNLDTIQNRIWFTLRLGSDPNADLQNARAHGAEHFKFEVLERLEEEESNYIRNSLLKERLAHWQASLNAKCV